MRVCVNRLRRDAALAAALLAGVALAIPARAQGTRPEPAHTVSAQESPQLFATMCALYAAGFDAEGATPGGDPVIIDLRAQMLGLQGAAADALRKFYRDHVLADPGATMSRYVTFALVAGPAPKFAVTMPRQDLPPDVLALEGFSDVLANFYREAHLDA